MSVRLFRSIKKSFRSILDWNNIKKSRAALVYASIIELGAFYLQIMFINNPYFNTDFLIKSLWYLPTILIINVFLFYIGKFATNNDRWNFWYSLIVGMFYSISLVVLPIAIGILNIANGVVFVGTILVSLILFDRRVVYWAMAGFVIVYLVLTMLTIMGYLDYAMAFKKHVLIHPGIEKTYILFSVIYTILYSAISILFFDMCVQGWKKKEQIIEKQSCTDDLTKLLNRRGINQIVHLQIQQARIADKETSLIVVDIDDFKKINDRFGHIQGDQVLIHIANILRSNLRASDIVGRYGGEEFIILLPFTVLKNARKVAEICREALENNTIETKDGQRIRVNASFGVSSTASSNFDFEELFEQADQALYTAKNNGKNQVQLAKF